MAIKYQWDFNDGLQGWTGDIGWNPNPAGIFTTPNASIGARKSGVVEAHIEPGDIIVIPVSSGGWIVPVLYLLDINDNIIKTIRLPQVRNANVCYIYSSDVSADKIKIYQDYDYAGFSIDNVTVFSSPDRIIKSPIMIFADVDREYNIPINETIDPNIIKYFSIVRMENASNIVSFSNTIYYDGSNTANIITLRSGIINVSNSVDLLKITSRADATMRYFQTLRYFLTLMNDEVRPLKLIEVDTYFNHNMIEPSIIQFSLVSPLTNTETETQLITFSASQLFNLILTAIHETTLDLTGVNILKAHITAKDSLGNVIDSCVYDILNGTQDKPLTIPKDYDGQDITLEVWIEADGQVSQAGSINLKYDLTLSPA